MAGDTRSLRADPILNEESPEGSSVESGIESEPESSDVSRLPSPYLSHVARVTTFPVTPTSRRLATSCCEDDLHRTTARVTSSFRKNDLRRTTVRVTRTACQIQRLGERKLLSGKVLEVLVEGDQTAGKSLLYVLGQLYDVFMHEMRTRVWQPPRTIIIKKKARETLGIYLAPAQEVDGFLSRRECFFVKTIVKGGPVCEDGRIAVGDILCTVNGQSLYGLSMGRAVAELDASKEITRLTIMPDAAGRGVLQRSRPVERPTRSITEIQEEEFSGHYAQGFPVIPGQIKETADEPLEAVPAMHNFVFDTSSEEDGEVEQNV